MDSYITSCLRFDENEYFERIVTNSTVRFYTVILNDYRVTNTTVQHYIYCFLQRMYAHKIENDRYGLSQGDSGANGATSTGMSNVTLVYLLFNIVTLNAINNLLCYNNITTKENTPLIRLLRCIVRTFAECASKNHMLYVEALFVHAHPIDFALSLDSIYDANMFATSVVNSRDRNNGISSGGSGGRGRGRDGDLDSDDEVSVDGSSTDEDSNTHTTSTTTVPTTTDTSTNTNVDYDFGDEFDENELPVTFNRLKKNTKRRMPPKSKSRSKSRLNSNSNSKSNETEEEVEENDDSGNNNNDSNNSNKKSQSQTQSQNNSNSVVNSPGKRKWTQEHDLVLKQQYSLYHGSYTCFDMIASHELLRYVNDCTCDCVWYVYVCGMYVYVYIYVWYVMFVYVYDCICVCVYVYDCDCVWYVFVCMCDVYVYICVVCYVYMCDVYVYMCLCVCVYIYIYVVCYVCICICVMYMCMYMCMCVYMCVVCIQRCI